MVNKKVFEVRLISSTMQYKNILASNANEAIEVAQRDDIEWNGKELVLDSEVMACPGEAYHGKYIEYVNKKGELVVDERFDESIHVNATTEDALQETRPVPPTTHSIEGLYNPDSEYDDRAVILVDDLTEDQKQYLGLNL